MSETCLYDVFISYAHEDEEFALSLYDKLAAFAFSVRAVEPECEHGEIRTKRIKEALDSSASCLLLLGPRGKWPWGSDSALLMMDEWAARSDEGFRLIPVSLPGGPDALPPDLPDVESLRRLRQCPGAFVKFYNNLDEDEATRKLILLMRGVDPDEQPLWGQGEFRHYINRCARNAFNVNWSKFATEARSAPAETYGQGLGGHLSPEELSAEFTWLSLFSDETNRARATRLSSSSSLEEATCAPAAHTLGRTGQWEAMPRPLRAVPLNKTRSVPMTPLHISSSPSPLIFISYVRRDETKVEDLYSELLACDYKPWMDRWDVSARQKCKLEIEEAVREADFLLLCLSDNSAGKSEVLRGEIEQALKVWQEESRDDSYVIPVLLEECQMPECLSNLRRIKLFGESGWSQLEIDLRAELWVWDGLDGRMPPAADGSLHQPSAPQNFAPRGGVTARGNLWADLAERLLNWVWLVVKQSWWEPAPGNSTAGWLLKRDALNDFYLSIERRAADSSPGLAVLPAIVARPFKRLTDTLRRTKGNLVGEIYESAIEQLNAGWRKGKAPEILRGYIKSIRESVDDSAIDDIARLRGRSALALVTYALGNLSEGSRLGTENWAEARRLESDADSQLKWIASYGYFNSTLFLGEFKKAMSLMADQWSRYYAPLDDNARESLRESLSGHLILNPVLAVPRHIILAAAFNEQPLLETRYWPSAVVFDNLTAEERGCKIKWVEVWYEEARRICPSEPTSLDLSHAYAAFYLTLLLLESGMPETSLHDKINRAFDAIDDSAAAVVAQYVKHGFRGVYHLACGEDEKALDNLSQAARLSAISGNRFADSLFMCCHAVAAARLNWPGKCLEPVVDYYLSEASRLARELKQPFYRKLFYGAKAAICLLRGDRTAARRFDARSKEVGIGNRILKLFYKAGRDRRADE